MKIKSLATASSFAVTVSLATGVACADPAPVVPSSPSASIQTDILPGIHYTASIVDGSVVLKTDGGSLTLSGNQFQLLDDRGNLVAGLPLTYRRDAEDWPIAARLDGNTAVLTPSTDPGSARPATPVGQPKPVASQEQWANAMATAATEFGLAISVGTLIGTLIGAPLGCVAGALTVGTITFPVFFAGALGGCLAGAATGVALGTAAGVVLLGVPVGIAVLLDFYNQVNAPDPGADSQ
ncbi:hypothetical protein D7D52_30015 [Nocardia yunnanensis]|uniref:DUF8020 domain-containing protein n=1 Tax=Nocardia yunnanensis TaxID=2382165 RepID=A0A386ZJB5_9NOCA|nr:hypothetical protein [Nocardia yunnanensis]AYF77353.1 hypothetical protein D7D52_30015 [Nocardia yunnanensis]